MFPVAELPADRSSARVLVPLLLPRLAVSVDVVPDVSSNMEVDGREPVMGDSTMSEGGCQSRYRPHSDRWKPTDANASPCWDDGRHSRKGRSTSRTGRRHWQGYVNERARGTDDDWFVYNV